MTCPSDVVRPAETNCGHTPLYAQDPVRWVERVTPCPYCTIEQLRRAVARLERTVERYAEAMEEDGNE